MKCSDIPDQPILDFLKSLDGVWATHGKGHAMPTVQDAMPDGTPFKLQVAKMKQLLKRKLVKGCGCGCRGDWRLPENSV